MTDGLKAEYRTAIIDILAANERVERVVLFGSRAMETFTPASDVDIALFGDRLALTDQANLAAAIDELPMAQRVDLLLHKTVNNEALRKHIEQHGVEWYRRRAREEIEREYVVLVDRTARLDGESGSLYRPLFPGHWTRAPLYSMAQWVNGLAFKNIEFTATGKPVIKIAEIKGGITGQTKFTQQIFDDSVRVRSGDLLFSWSGQPETSINAFWWRGQEGWLNQHVFRVTPSTGIDSTFFFFLLRYLRPNFVAIARNKQTTGLGHVTKRDLENIEAAFPPLPEQRAIAHILGTLDDKIELNRRRNETLEEMARALFKSWFIDFDPVHAKATLKRHTAAQITPPLRGSRQAKGDSPQARRWREIKRLYSPQTLQKAQALRHNQTNAEGLLWHYLRNKQLAGYKFRRQQPIGPYIVDFACLSQKVLIELDGGHHAEQQAQDEARDRFLQSEGYRVLRFWNHEVFENCFGVLEAIRAAVQDPPPQPSAPDGLPAATPPQGGSDWNVERARAYLDGMDPGIAALFPDSFVDSEVGAVPEGWEVRSLGKVVETVKGRSYRRKELIKSDTALVTLKSFARGGGYRPDGLKPFAGTYSSDQVVHPGEIVIACTDVTQAAEVIGRPAIVQATAVYRTLVASLDTLIVRPSRKCMTRTFLYFLAISDEFVAHTYAHTTGTTVLHLAKNAVPSYRFIQPPTRLVQCFDDIAGPLLERIQEAQKECEFLAVLRDTLLPKLISGELRVKDMKKALEQH